MTRKKKSGRTQFVESVTVSSKGQISIPTHIRRKLNIATGDRLLIILRKDEDGINLIKETALDSVFQKLSR